MATLTRVVLKRSNTIEENKKVLSELLRKPECLEPSQEELNRLLTRLNDHKARDNRKNLKSYEPACSRKKVLDPIYGPVPGIPCGSWWGIRMDCSRDRMHDPFSASVQCGPVGATSICTSGETSDVDLGDILSFTGQSIEEKNCDDRLLGELDENRALVLNMENRVPVRVVRSYNLSNEYSPKTGYRYDGLYMVVDYWIAVCEWKGSSCYKFALRRLSQQDSPAWKKLGTKNSGLQNCDPRRLTRSPVSRGERGAMRLRTRESKTMKVVKSVRKRRRRSSEGNEEPESIQVPTPTTTMLLHALPGRKTMAANKNVNVSAIVTRRVSKKLQKNSVDKLPMHDCAKFGVGEIQPGNERGDEDAQSQSTRLQNTNISIRTDLYDSSHNLKQSVRKCGSQASHGLGTFKPRVLPVQRREITFAGMDSGPGSSRTTSCVKMERVKANHEAESEKCSKGESDTSTSSDSAPQERRDEEKTELCEPEAAGSFEGPRKVSPSFKGSTNSSWAENSIMMNSLTLEKVLDIIRDDKSSQMAQMLISNVIGAHPFSQERQNTDNNRPPNVQETPPTIETSSFENSAQDFGDESNLPQESGKDSSDVAPVVEQPKTSEENGGEDIPRVQTRNRNTWPLGSEDSVDFCWAKPGSTMRGEKKLWKAQSISDSSGAQADDKISNAKIITRSRCVQNAENTDTNSRLNVPEADATGRDKPTNKMKLEMANLFIDMNMSPSSRVSESRSRRSLRGANYSRRRTCPAVVDRGCKRRSDEPVKHPSSPLKRLKKSVVKIQNNSGKILGAVISKKGLSLRKKTRNNLNNNNNNNTNNNNNSVKRIVNPDKSTMMSKKERQNSVEKKNSALPKRRDNKERILTRSRGSLAVGRLRLRRTLLPGVETYPRKKKKTKEKQKPTTVEKRKIVTTDDKKSKRAKIDYKRSGGDVERPEMISVMTQCSLIPDSPNRSGTTSECICSSRNSEADRVKNENIELIEIKSEALDDDVAQEDEDLEVDPSPKIGGSTFLGLSQSLGSLPESESEVIPKQGFIRYVAGSRPRPSAFVAVRSVEASLRIAQLKSIGFKPIKPDGSESQHRDSSDSPKIAYSSAVVKRGVQEEYIKYTSEENNVVQYMDSMLCYEDIENEDVSFTEEEIFVDKIEYDVEEESSSIVREEEEEEEEVDFSTDDVKEWETQIDPNSSNSESIEQNVVDSDGDVPWHGWRKIGSNREPHFVGW